MQSIVLTLLWLYRYTVSPLLPARCRYLPTCSAYAAEAVRLHGPVRGLWYALNRVCRCHPGYPGGHDPVPAPPSSRPKPDPT